MESQKMKKRMEELKKNSQEFSNYNKGYQPTYLRTLVYPKQASIKKKKEKERKEKRKRERESHI